MLKVRKNKKQGERESLNNPPFILASTSPRRRDMLMQLQIPFEARAPKNGVETRKRGEGPSQMVKRLSLEKAESVIEEINEDYSHYILLASDTIVVAPNQKTILGKPKNPADAKKMLRQISGKTHTVFSGYSILYIQNGRVKQKVAKSVSTKVTIKKLSKSEIDHYVATKEPLDKAGSYAAQGIGMGLVEKIIGSYSNVVGLPLTQVMDDIETLGFSFFLN